MVGQEISRPKRAKSAQRRPFIPTLQAGQVLLDLAITQYLTIDQIVRLYLSPNSLRFAQKRMSRLTEEGYTLRLFLQREQPSGTAPTMFTLADKGREYAENHGYTISKRYRPSDEDGRNPLYLKHAVALSDVYVSLKRLEKDCLHLCIEEFQHERFLQGLPKVNVAGRERFVRPDAAVVLKETAPGGSFLHPLTVEVDLGTEKQAKWRDKLLGLLAFAESPGYEALFHTDAIRIAVITPRSERRAVTLCRWTETLLVERGVREAGAWFRFTADDPATVAPAALWTRSDWLEPFNQSPTPLLELELSGG